MRKLQSAWGCLEDGGAARSSAPTPYVYVDGICLKRSWGGACENVAVMVAATEANALAVAEEHEAMRLAGAAGVVREGFSETLAYSPQALAANPCK